jgi:hypothetical protein
MVLEVDMAMAMMETPMAMKHFVLPGIGIQFN